jgi:hypothetical protein
MNLKETEAILTDLVEKRLIRPAEGKELPPDFTEGYAYLLVDVRAIPKGDWDLIPSSILGDIPERLR